VLIHPTTSTDSLENRELTEDDVFLNGRTLEQNDIRLLEFIRQHHLRPPSPNPYQLKKPTEDPSKKMGIRAYVHKLLGEPVRKGPILLL
jgi:hypothetical protein